MFSRGALELEALGKAGKVVVLAPHPDDEVFAVGGLMSLMIGRGYDVVVLAVTDGEASHANSSRITPDEVRAVRLAETELAYQELGIAPGRVRLGFPDAHVASLENCLRMQIKAHLAGAIVVLAPIETDGHPDHDSVGRAARMVTESLGLPLWQFAVWARLDEKRERIALGEPLALELPKDVARRKRRAMQVYSSQFVALGPEPEDGPVLPANFAQYFAGNEEYLWPAN